ncbi:MAG: hypothetical protein HS107_06270 [Thermoflexaceae bacterium]|nr:hypothetical protein [Thermoflexaceae bacterium]
MLSFSWGAFLVYLAALLLMVGGGFYGLLMSEHPAFLAPILMGLFFFYLCWEAVVETGDDLPPPQKQR